MKRKRCKGCRELFERVTPKDILCPECKELLAIGQSKDVMVIERARAEYNKRHSICPTYGRFVRLIKDIEERKKASNELEAGSRQGPQKLPTAQAEP